MRHTIKEILYIIVLAVVAVSVLWFVLSRIRFIVVTMIPWWVLGLLILIPIVVLVLIIDHFIE